MADNEPKDFRLARRAYEAFWGEQPQIWFDQLSHAYQMRWVNVAREVIKEVSRGNGQTVSTVRIKRRRDPDPITNIDIARSIMQSAPKPGPDGRRDYGKMHPNAVRRIKNAIKYIRMHKE